MISFFTKLWRGETTQVTTAAFIVGTAALASRLVGVLRDRVLASTFGAGDVLDAYFAAFRVPDFLYNLVILGALSAAFIPVFTQYLEKDKREAWRLAERVLSVVAVVMGIACLILFFAAPALVPLTVPGFDGEKLALTISLSRIMLLSTFFLALSGVMGGILQATRRFFAFSLAPIFYNIGIIIGVVLLVPSIGEWGLGWGVVIGAGLHLAVQAAVVLRLGLERIPTPSLRHPGVRRILFLMAPRSAGLAVTQVNMVVMIAIASTLAVGSVAVFNLATNLQTVPIGIIAISFAVAAFPSLSRAAANHDNDEFKRVLGSTTRKIIFLILPATVAFLILRAQIVRIILGEGVFDWDDTLRTAHVLGIMASSLLAQSLVPLLARAFYALQDTWTPLWIGIIAEAANITLALALRDEFGILGLATAFSVAAWLSAFLLWTQLRQKQGRLGTREVIDSTIRTCIAALAFAAAALPVRIWIGTVFDLRAAWQVLLQAGASTIAGLAAFILVAALLKSPELHEFRRAAERKLFKKASVSEGMEGAQGL